MGYLPIRRFLSIYEVSAGKRDQIEFFFKKKFLSKIDVDLIIWSRTFVISKKKFLSIWSLFPALTPDSGAQRTIMTQKLLRELQAKGTRFKEYHKNGNLMQTDSPLKIVTSIIAN